MPVHIGVIRAVNVGGHGGLGMDDLRATVASLGFTDVRTYLATGNVLFRSAGRAPPSLERALEVATRDRTGIATDFIVRTSAEWDAARAANPFPDAARDDPAHLTVIFLKGPPARGAEGALRAAIRGREQIRVVGTQAYAVYPDGIGRSKLTLPVIERHLGFRGTARNWSTVSRLAALASG